MWAGLVCVQSGSLLASGNRDPLVFLLLLFPRGREEVVPLVVMGFLRGVLRSSRAAYGLGAS